MRASPERVRLAHISALMQYRPAYPGSARHEGFEIRVDKQARIAQLDRAVRLLLIVAMGAQAVGSNPAASLPLGQNARGRHSHPSLLRQGSHTIRTAALRAEAHETAETDTDFARKG